jgi:tetratricopeptide (TPR) repeat protein
MSQRLTRKEIKKDDFADVVGRGVEYAEGHVRTLIYAIVAVVVLAAVGIGIWMFMGSRSSDANDALSVATKAYSAPINATGAKPDDPTSPSFADEAARRARAKALFQKVRDQYGSTDAADVAGVYLAQIALNEGKPEEARKLWTDFVDDHSDNILAGEVRINLIHLDRKQGPKEKVEELATRLKAMLEESEPPLPEDVILSELGTTYEQLGRKEDAMQSYKRIMDEFPQSGYRTAAQERLSTLDPSRPATARQGAFPMQGSGS